MKKDDSELIWESYVREDASSGQHKYNHVAAQIKDLVNQKKDEYPEISDQDAFDVSIEDLESYYEENGDEDAVSILHDISSKRGVTESNPTRVRDDSEQNMRLFEMFYHGLIDQHGGDKPATSYTGLNPIQGDSEAKQFLNVLLYLIDAMSPAKKNILLDIIDDRSTSSDKHLNMVYELSEMSADELNGLLDGGSLPL